MGAAGPASAGGGKWAKQESWADAAAREAAAMIAAAAEASKGKKEAVSPLHKVRLGGAVLCNSLVLPQRSEEGPLNGPLPQSVTT